MACVKADRAWALRQVRAGRIPSAISRLLQLHARKSRMSWSVAELRISVNLCENCGDAFLDTTGDCRWTSTLHHEYRSLSEGQTRLSLNHPTYSEGAFTLNWLEAMTMAERRRSRKLACGPHGFRMRRH
jgi:hypothetical protein